LALNGIQPNDLRDNGPVRHGVALKSGRKIISDVRALSGIELDTTYTAKVVAFLKDQTETLADLNILYWNTFSPQAFNGSLVSDSYQMPGKRS
jgi:hypothetical protein